MAIPLRSRLAAQVTPRGAPPRGRAAAPSVPAGSRRPNGIVSRMAALGWIGGLAVLGPLMEGGLGGGRGLAMGFLLMVIAPSLVRAGGVRLHPLDPETFVPLAYFLSAGYSPILHLVLSNDLTLTYAEINAFRVAYLGAVGCALVCTAFSKVPQDPAAAGSPLPERLLPRDWAVIATGMVGAASIGVWIGVVGVGNLLTASYGDTYAYEEGMGLLVSGWYLIQLTIVYCVARIADLRSAGKRVPRLLYAASGVMLVVFMLNTLLGRRGPLLWVLLASTLCLHLSGVRIRRIWMAVAACAVVVYTFALEGYRSELGQGAGASFAAAQANIARVENPLVIPELEVVFKNLAVVVNERPPIVLYPGESWINAFLILIPKPLWPERPIGMAWRYVSWLSPSTARGGGGYAFNATAEGFVNFGEVGAVVEIGVFALLFFFLPMALCEEKRRGPLARAVACCVGSFAYNQFRGELASLLKVVITFLLAAFLVFLMSTVLSQIHERFSRPISRDPRLGIPGRRGEVYRRAPGAGGAA